MRAVARLAVLLLVLVSQCSVCSSRGPRAGMGKSKKAKTTAACGGVAVNFALPKSVVLRGPPVVPPGCSECDGFEGGVETAASAAGRVPAGQVDVLWEDADGPAVIALQPALSPAECRAWIDWGESKGFALEKLKQTAFNAHRDNGRLAIDSPEVAAAIWERIRPVTPPHLDGRAASGCNSNIRLYKYQPGQRFGKHIDQSNYLGEEMGATEYTVLLYLNDGVSGGETVFYKDHDGEHEVNAV